MGAGFGARAQAAVGEQAAGAQHQREQDHGEQGLSAVGVRVHWASSETGWSAGRGAP